jgi:hypothetical protein
MSTTATHTKAGSLAPRRRLVALAVLALSALGLGTAAADTHLSRWENNTSCSILVKGNGGDKVIPAHSTYDFGPTPKKDPQDIVVEPVGSCDIKLKRATIDWTQTINDPNVICRWPDHGPYWFVVNNGSGNQNVCYCVKTLLTAYLDVVISPTGVSLRYTNSGFQCNRR